MPQTVTEVRARSLLHRAFEMLFHDGEHNRDFDSILACAEAELQKIYDGWSDAHEPEMREEVILNGTDTDGR